eukprot:gene6647-9123_t
MSTSSAVCAFCSRSDTSIQVICEARCLICSRCQLMPGIRKLLLDYSQIISLSNNNITTITSNNGVQYQKIVAKCGSCPICEQPMAHNMLQLIKSFRDGGESGQEENFQSYSKELLEFDEPNTAISSFLKKFRTTYGDDAAGEVKSVTPSTPSRKENNNSDMKRRNSNPQSLPPVASPPAATSLKDITKKFSAKDIYASIPPKATIGMVMEFANECYAAHWLSISRNVNESMVTTMLRISNRKKFSQRTNDFKAKSLIDFMSGPSGSESLEALLFGILIGLQPKLANTISPAWANISTTILVVAHCDRCLKSDQLIDQNGNPTVTEFKNRLNRTLNFPKIITLKKAVRIISFLLSNKHPYFTISALSASCVEYNSELPWQSDSVSKLFNVLFFVVFYETLNGNNDDMKNDSFSPRAIIDTKTNFNRINSPHSMKSGKDSSKTMTRNLTGATLSSSETGLRTPTSSDNNTKTNSIGNNNSSNLNNNNNTNEFKFDTRIGLMKSLNTIINDIWKSSSNQNLSNLIKNNIYNDTQKIVDYISNADILKDKFSFVRLSLENAHELAENLTISLSEFIIVCVKCWECEYRTTLYKISKTSISSQRRNAIVGHYDSSKASLNAIEKLSFIRILKWFEYDTFRGIDWDHVQEQFSNKILPFHVPISLLQKSKNELIYLAKTTWNELQDRKNIEEMEDLLVEFGPYSRNDPSLTKGSMENALLAHAYVGEINNNTVVTKEDFDKYNRANYLSKQTLGGITDYNNSADMLDDNISPNLRVLHHSNTDKYLLGSNNDKIIRKTSSTSEVLTRRSTPAHQLTLVKSLHDDNNNQQIEAFEKDFHDLLKNNHQSIQARMHHSPTMNAGTSLSGIPAQFLSPEQNEEDIILHHNNGINHQHYDNIFDVIDNADENRYEDNDGNSFKIKFVINTQQQTSSFYGQNSNSNTPKKEQQINSSTPSQKLKRTFSTTDDMASGIIRSSSKTIINNNNNNYNNNYYYNNINSNNDDDNKRKSSVSHAHKIHIIQSKKLANDDNMNNNEDFQAENGDNSPQDNYYMKVQEYENAKIIASRERVLKRISANLVINNDNNDNNNNNNKTNNHNNYVTSAIDIDSVLIGTSQINISNIMQTNNNNNNNNNKQKNNQNYQINNRLTQILDLKSSIDPSSGNFTIDLSTHLSVQKLNLIISLSNSNISLKTFEEFINNYLNNWQLESIIKLDLSYIHLGLPGSILLSSKLQLKSNLIHINFNDFHLGDMGLKKVLSAMIQANGQDHLLRLDLINNDITIATNAFGLLQYFTNLRFLDVSKNGFSLDTSMQQKTFAEGLLNLHSLE